MEKIGADLSLYRPYIRKHDNRILVLFLNYSSLDMFREPWLDVGAGENYMRGLLAEEMSDTKKRLAILLMNIVISWQKG